MTGGPIHLANTPVITESRNTSAYGESIVALGRETVSGNASYNFIPSNFRTFISGAGTASVEDQLFKVESGTSLGDFGTIRSFRAINYKSGQSAAVRFSGLFESNASLSWSAMGAFNVGDELSFGYNGATFGIWHRYGGKAEIQELQVTTPAGGSENATVTINSVIYTVPLTSGTVQDNAFEIADYLQDNATGIGAYQLDDTVVIEFLSDGDKTGTFSFSSSTAVASFTEITAGVTKTSTHIPQSSWNQDIANYLDPSKGNTYEISYQSGFGDMYFKVQDNSGSMRLVHIIKWANSSSTLNLGNPSLHVGCYATALTTLSSSVVVKMSYVAGLVHGELERTRNPRGYSNSKSIGTTNTNILTIRNSKVYNGLANQIQIQPISLSLSNEGNKTAVFELRGNPDVTGTTNFQNIGNNLVSDIDIAGETVSGGRLFDSFTVSPGASAIVDLRSYEIAVPSSLRICISGRLISGSSADLSASIAWYEDV